MQQIKHYSLDDVVYYLYLITYLHEHVNLICDLVTLPPTSHFYHLAKQTIIERVTHTPHESIPNIQQEVHLSKKKPSQLWWHLHLPVSKHAMPDLTLMAVLDQQAATPGPETALT